MLRYYATEDGGRTSPAHSGYRPQIKFEFEEMQTSGQQAFIGKDRVRPGETVAAESTMLSPHIFKYKLSAGMTFEFREGARIIGTGKILELLNGELKIVSEE